MSTFGDMMRESLQANGYSLRAACRAMHRDASYPGRVQAGKEPPSPELARDLDRLLNTDRFTTALAQQRQPVPQQRQPEATNDAIAALELARQASVSEVGGDTIDLLEASFDELAIQYQTTSPTALYPQVRDHLSYVGQLLDKRKTAREHLALLHLGGWFSLLAATLKVDLADTPTARAQLRTAASLAREAGTPVIAAWALETHAWEALTAQDYPRALKLAQNAAEAAPEGSSALIQATAQQGRAWARLGNVDETRAAIARVEALATQDPSQPKHHFAYDPAKQLSYTATALAWAGDVHAERAAREVIEVYPSQPDPRGWPRRLATANLDLSLALAKRGELDESAGLMSQVIESGKLVPSTKWRAIEVIDNLGTFPEAEELREMLD